VDEYLSALFEPWLTRHSHWCVVGFVPVFLAFCHLWLKTSKLWKVMRMRGMDSFLHLEGPRPDRLQIPLAKINLKKEDP
jgi:hypothetical protein